MLPTAYEFHWDTGHIVFLGVFYTVLAVVISTVILASLRARRDMKKQREADIARHESFAAPRPRPMAGIVVAVGDRRARPTAECCAVAPSRTASSDRRPGSRKQA